MRPEPDAALRGVDLAPVEWIVADGVVDYAAALAAMDRRVEAIGAGAAGEAVWLLEHPPTLTAGTSAKPEDLKTPRFPVHEVGRGGQYTYHGPGQRVAYAMLDLNKRKRDLRAYVSALEAWIIAALSEFNVVGERREERVGVWVRRPDKGPGHEDKIAAIGIRVRRWITLHGVAVNVEPDLSHFDAITPCGVADPRFGVTSLVDLGLPVTMADLDVALMVHFERIFGSTVRRDAL